jgi:putative tryptophan/tyrosine transport system substrate-binding protein
MIRRAFALALIALATFLGLFTAEAEPPAKRIGVLLVGFSPESKEVDGLRQGLREAGYVEGRNLTIDWRFANGDYDKVSGFVTDLVQSQVDVIVVETTLAAQAVKRATSTIPVVMTTVSDPVGSGLVASLGHPGGNITGLSVMLGELSTKRLQLLKEAMPKLTRVAVLWNPTTPWQPKVIEDLKAVAPAMGLELTFVATRNAEEIGAAFSAMARARAEALYILGDAFFLNHRSTLLDLASKARIPATYGVRQYADAGALMSYGPNLSDVFRRAAGYVDKILKGAKPGDLPIEQPTKFELVVNLRTAKTLGLTIPQSILVRADEVIR